MKYLPVQHFGYAVVEDAIEGYALPAGGLSPCLVGLFADETPIAFGRAARFSEAAEAEGRRRGWCGFSVPGLTAAMALGRAELRCMVSGRVLATPEMPAGLFERTITPGPSLSVFEVMALAREGESCATIQQLAEFGLAHARRHGFHSFMHATYQMFFSRDADNAVIGPWMQSKDPETEIENLLHCIVLSDEFQRKTFPHLPGPFQDSFRYDTSILGA